MENLLSLLSENAEWLFGGTSVAALLLAYFNRTENAKAGNKSQNAPQEKGPRPRSQRDLILYGLIAAAVASGGLSLMNTTSVSSSGDGNLISSGAKSTNIISENSRVSVDSEPDTANKND